MKVSFFSRRAAKNAGWLVAGRILTDLMERQMAIHGELVMANLVEGVAVVREAA